MRKLNLKQSFADPQILIYDAEEHNGTKLSNGMKFCVAQNFSVGDADYNQNNAYCFTCPLTAEGKRQNLTLTLGKVGELHGGADGETRNSYYTIPASRPADLRSASRNDPGPEQITPDRTTEKYCRIGMETGFRPTGRYGNIPLQRQSIVKTAT